MKKLFFLVNILLTCYTAIGQVYQYPGSYGFQSKRELIDSVLNIPFQTSDVVLSNFHRPGAIKISTSDSTVRLSINGTTYGVKMLDQRDSNWIQSLSPVLDDTIQITIVTTDATPDLTEVGIPMEGAVFDVTIRTTSSGMGTPQKFFTYQVAYTTGGPGGILGSAENILTAGDASLSTASVSFGNGSGSMQIEVTGIVATTLTWTIIVRRKI